MSDNAPWTDGYWFALRNLHDEAVQADLKSLGATRDATPDVPHASVETAADGLSTGSAPRPAKESGATDISSCPRWRGIGVVGDDGLTKLERSWHARRIRNGGAR